MITLGIDIAQAPPYFSITQYSNVLISKTILKKNKTSEQLIILLKNTLKEKRLSWININRLCINVGPGSFTGIRIALATIWGLSLGNKIPIAGISSFDLWKWNFRIQNIKINTDIILIALNTNSKKNIYIAIFSQINNKYIELGICPKQKIYKKINCFNKITIIGNTQLILPSHIKSKIYTSQSYNINQKTISLWGSRLSQKKFNEKAKQKLEPFYIQNPNITFKNNKKKY